MSTSTEPIQVWTVSILQDLVDAGVAAGGSEDEQVGAIYNIVSSGNMSAAAVEPLLTKANRLARETGATLDEATRSVCLEAARARVVD